MSLEYRALVSGLKLALKAKRVNYRQVAEHLEVSEQTIKRLLTADDGAVGRLAEICDFLGISFFEIARMAAEEREQVFRISDAQEEYFCQQPADYAFFADLLKGRTPAQIREEYGVTKARAGEILRRLEAACLIERLAGDGIRLLVEGTHNWIHGGPMQLRFIAEDNATFLEFVAAKLGPSFPDDHFFTGADRRVSEATAKDFIRELRDTFIRFRKKAQTEESLMPEDKLIAVKWVACLAPYVSSFGQYLRAERS